MPCVKYHAMPFQYNTIQYNTIVEAPYVKNELEAQYGDEHGIENKSVFVAND